MVIGLEDDDQAIPFFPHVHVQFVCRSNWHAAKRLALTMTGARIATVQQLPILPAAHVGVHPIEELAAGKTWRDLSRLPVTVQARLAIRPAHREVDAGDFPHPLRE